MRKLALSLMLTVCALAHAQDVKYEKYTLPNGMKVILHEDHSLPVVAVNILYRVGSKDEPARRSGFAHLFEHLMFMGTDRVPTGQFDKIMESGGGGNNATTFDDYTDYYDSGPSSQLSTLLWLESDRLEDLGKAMTQQKLDLQREVVKNERRENYENAPYGKADLFIQPLMYPEGHPYHIPGIGLPEDLDAATVKDVQDFFATYYVPNNACLVVAGDFASAVVKPQIASLFGTLPRKDEPIHKVAPFVSFTGVKRETLVDKVPEGRTYMVWHAPGAFKPGSVEMDLTSEVLSSGISSRLYQSLVYQNELASDVAAYVMPSQLESLFVVEATANPGVDLSKIESTIDKTLKTYLSAGPTKEELKRVVAGHEYSALSGLQNVENLADQMNTYEFFLGNPNAFKSQLNKYRNATPLSVLAVAKEYLKPDSRLILRVIPGNDVPKQNPRDKQPELPKEKPFSIPAPTAIKLSNGVRVMYWQRPQLPLMTLTAFLKAGADIDPAQKAGRTQLMSEMLLQGAAGLGAVSFEKAVTDLGASLYTSADHGYSTTTLSVTSANFAPALQLMADAMLRPSFNPKELSRIKQVDIEGVKQDLEDPEAVARRTGLQQFFGESNPWGRPLGGTVQSLQDLQLEDLKQAYRVIYQPANTTFYAAGSLPPSKVKALLDQNFGKWKNSGSSVPKPTYPQQKPDGLKVVLVDMPGAVQTVIRFVMPAPSYNDPNRPALEAIGTILGGTFTSRLNTNLREQKGYTYGAGSSYVFTPELGYFVSSADVRADVTGASLKEFLNEFNKIRKGDIADEELLKAVRSERTGIVQALSSVNSLVGAAVGLASNGKPLSSLTLDMQASEKLTAAQLNALTKSAIPLESGVLVLVGDKETVLKQMDGLGLPQPTIVKPH